MKKVLVVSPESEFTQKSAGILSGHFQVAAFGCVIAALDTIYNEIPDAMIVEIIPGDGATEEGLHTLKGDPLFTQIPVIAVFRSGPTALQLEKLPVEDYLRREEIDRDLLKRVQLAVLRSSRLVEVNPLTRLPGNISISRQIQKRLDGKESFAFAYADLSEFKPFNDRYGFSRGDEVIRITGRLILNIVKSRQPEGSFVGHIGGDDFVFIMDRELIEDVCRNIIDVFDRIVPTLYDAADQERGGIESKDRRGTAQFFPFIRMYIGVTNTTGRRFSHFGELTGSASEMKAIVKTKNGSSFCVDKRGGD